MNFNIDDIVMHNESGELFQVVGQADVAYSPDCIKVYDGRVKFHIPEGCLEYLDHIEGCTAEDQYEKERATLKAMGYEQDPDNNKIFNYPHSKSLLPRVMIADTNSVYIEEDGGFGVDLYYSIDRLLGIMVSIAHDIWLTKIMIAFQEDLTDTPPYKLIGRLKTERQYAHMPALSPFML